MDRNLPTPWERTLKVQLSEQACYYAKQLAISSKFYAFCVFNRVKSDLSFVIAYSSHFPVFQLTYFSKTALFFKKFWLRKQKTTWTTDLNNSGSHIQY